MNLSLIVAVVIVALFLFSAVRVLDEYERGVIFRLGRFFRVKGPGLIIVIPVIDRMVRVGLRLVTMDVPPQDIITRDNVSVKVNAVSTSASWTPRRPSSRWRTSSTPRASSARPPSGACSASWSWTTSSPSGTR